jgi:hypothetical protein
MEGINLTKIYCKPFCKCHSVPPEQWNTVLHVKVLSWMLPNTDEGAILSFSTDENVS